MLILIDFILILNRVCTALRPNAILLDLRNTTFQGRSISLHLLILLVLLEELYLVLEEDELAVQFVNFGVDVRLESFESVQQLLDRTV